MKKEKDTAGVIAPPPIIFLSGLMLGVIIHFFYSRFYLIPSVYIPIAQITAGLLIAFGLGIILVAKIKMQRANTNIEPWKPTTSIITDGIYAYSRNPIYVAMVLIYLGVAIIINSVWILSLLGAVIFVMYFGVVLREERYLEKKFGAEYFSYKERVRRWI